MLTPSGFSIFVTTGHTTIREAWSSAAIQYAAYTTTMPSDTDVYEDGWIGRMPKMRQWLGPRIVNEPAPQTYSVAMQVFEATYGFDMFKMADDKLGVYYPILADLGLQSRRDPEFQIRDLLENSGAQTGARQNGLDGLTFFNTAHPVDYYDSSKGTYSNDFSGGFSASGVTVGGALTGVAFGTACEYMMTYKAEDGERLAIMPNMLILPPNLKAEGEYILKNTFSGAQSWNTWGGSVTNVGASDNLWKRFGAEYLINENLTKATTWYLADTTKSVKPLRFLQREAPVFTPRVSPNDDNVFSEHMYLWGVYYRGTPAWSPSWLMARSAP